MTKFILRVIGLKSSANRVFLSPAPLSLEILDGVECRGSRKTWQRSLQTPRSIAHIWLETIREFRIHLLGVVHSHTTSRAAYFRIASTAFELLVLSVIPHLSWNQLRQIPRTPSLYPPCFRNNVFTTVMHSIIFPVFLQLSIDVKFSFRLLTDATVGSYSGSWPFLRYCADFNGVRCYKISQCIYIWAIPTFLVDPRVWDMCVIRD